MRFATIEEISGQWFVSLVASHIDPGSLRWQDRGDGPELVEPPGVFGPFETEEEAQDWLDTYRRVNGED